MSDNDSLERRHRNEEERDADRLFKIRNILNIIFMIGVVVGVVLYFYVAHNVGTIVILSAIVFKLIECSLRFFH